MTTTPPMKDWQDEPWARRVTALGEGERAALIRAAQSILAQSVSDPLESELTVLIECAQFDDLDRSTPGESRSPQRSD